MISYTSLMFSKIVSSTKMFCFVFDKVLWELIGHYQIYLNRFLSQILRRRRKSQRLTLLNIFSMKNKVKSHSEAYYNGFKS